MGANVRRIWIAVTARLRQVGLAPWIVFLGWSVFCTAQEAAVLRMSGILLREPAMWGGAAILWMIFATPQTSQVGVLARLATTTVLLLAVTATTIACLGVADLVTGRTAPGPGSALSAAWFLLALAPVGLALAVSAARGPVGSTQAIIEKVVMVLSFGPAAVLVAAPWSAADTRSLLAATGLSICASLLRMIAASGDPLLWAPTRKQT